MVSNKSHFYIPNETNKIHLLTPTNKCLASMQLFNYHVGDIQKLAYFQYECIRAKEINAYEARKLRMSFGAFQMTPQEEHFKTFFNQELEFIAVNQMSDLDLAARIEKLELIAREAKATLAGAMHAKRERDANKKAKTGFVTSIRGDELATEAINRVAQRQKKLDKNEKLRENIIQLQMNSGMSRLDAEKTADHLMSASAIKAQKIDKIKPEPAPKPTSDSNKPVTNPFAMFAKPVVEDKVTEATEVIISDESTTIVVEAKPEPKPIFNPFNFNK